MVRRKAASTVTTYKWVFKAYAKWLDQIKRISFADITTAHFTAFWIKEWMAHMTQQGLSDATVCLRFAVIKSFICFIAAEDPALAEVYAGIASLTCSRKPSLDPVRYLTAPQISLLLSMPDLKTDKGLRDLTLLHLGYETGVRVSEILAIRLCDIIRDGNHVKIRLHGKSSKIREHPL